MTSPARPHNSAARLVDLAERERVVLIEDVEEERKFQLPAGEATLVNADNTTWVVTLYFEVCDLSLQNALHSTPAAVTGP